MRFFVAGGTGFLGSHLIGRLLEDGHEVYALVRNEPGPLSSLNGVRFVKGDLGTLRAEDVPDCEVFICFAWGGVNRQEISNPAIQELNVQNELSLFKLASVHGCRLFIDAGSRQEYSFSDSPLTEESECMPVSEYGKAKLRAYRLISDMSLDLDIKYIHPRIFSIYGYGDHPWSLISQSLLKLKNNEDIELGPCSQKWSFLHIDDFVDAIMAIIERSERLSNNVIFNVGSSDNRVLRSFVEQIAAATCTTGRLLFGSFAQNAESAKSIICDSSKIKTLLGWTERYTFEQGIKELTDN